MINTLLTGSLYRYINSVDDIGVEKINHNDIRCHLLCNKIEMKYLIKYFYRMPLIIKKT